jgi:hypothetical protein
MNDNAKDSRRDQAEPQFESDSEKVAEAPLSPKQALFDDLAREFIRVNGLGLFFDDSKTLPFFAEIRSSCRAAQDKFTFWTPKVPVASAAEQAQAENLFIELRHGANFVAALTKYAGLIQAHQQDQKWLDAIADTIKGRKQSKKTPPDLDFELLKGWLVEGFWGLSNKDRSLALERVHGLRRVGEDALRIHIRALGLRDWADFPQFYYDPPLGQVFYTAEGESEGSEGAYQLFWHDWVYAKLGLPIPPPE